MDNYYIDKDLFYHFLNEKHFLIYNNEYYKQMYIKKYKDTFL